MKKNALKTTGGMVLAVLIISTLTLGTVFAQDGTKFQADGGGRLEGTWDVQLTVLNCQTGAPLRTLPELATFMSGGTMFDSTSGVPQSLKTPGHGVWSHTIGNIYRFSFKSFSFDPSGTFTGWTIVRHDLTLNLRATEYTSTGTAEVYNASGVLIFTGCSTTIATRFE